MFILRKLFKEHNKNAYTESNEILGDSYTTVTEHNEGWETLAKDWDHIGQKIYCFILHDGGSKVIPLYQDQGNYIMTSDGNTFANVTYRK